MQQQFLISVALAVLNAAGALGQAASPTPDPLHQFISGVQNGANAINSGVSAESAAAATAKSSTSTPSSSSTSPTTAPVTSTAAAHHGLSNGAKIGIIVGCVIAAVLLIGILLGICCCLMLRKRRRSKRVNAPIAEDEKAYESRPMNPGRSYSPVSSGHHHSMEQHPTVPLMAAGAIPRGTHSQAPSLSQHPAMRNPTHENPFADNVGGPQHNSHHGLEAGLAGATAAGAVGYGLHHHNKAVQDHPTASAQMTPTTHNGLNSHNGNNTHRGLESGLAGATAAGVAGHERQHHNQSGTHRPFSLEGLPPAAHGLPPVVATSPTSGNRVGDRGQYHDYDIPQQSSALPQSMSRNENPGHQHDFSPRPDSTSGSGLNTLPSSSHPASNSHNVLKAGAGGAAVAGAAAYGVHRHEEKKRDQSRSRSRSHSRPRSGVLPTRNNADRPPTPFGLSGIGQPYEDMHVHVLQSEAPSNELQHSLQSREGLFVGGASNNQEQPKSRNSRGYSTPPQVPSRSPNRDKRSSMLADSSTDSMASNNTTSSNSGGEQYNRFSDPYQPAQPHRNVAPWEQHQTRYSGTPPTSATMTPPPVPWESQEYAQHQRRQNHSPRQSMDASGRRSSRSPATSINGQPRRLRFEDLQPSQGPASGSGNARYSGAGPAGQHNSYDEYGHARWGQGVGEAM